MIKVMLADDEPIIIRGLKKLFPWEKYGLELIGDASNGVELLQAVQEKTPDLLISDISMPGLTGIDVVKEIRQLNLQTRVIFVSAFNDPAYVQSAKEYGVEDYLTKPINKGDLEKAVLKTISDISREH